MGGGGPEEQARSAITDQGGVSIDSTDNLYVTDSAVEVGDLLSEGVIEGLTSGKYTYAGTKGQTGFYLTGFAPYTASGIALSQDKELGFLRSVYWNDVPVVDINGYYNFADVNLEYVKGEPVGNLPALNSKLPANETVDLTVHRAIGERLYGISIQGGTQPTATKTPPNLPNDTKIDAVAKTYTILNKECTSLEVKIKIPALWEQIRNDKAPKKHEVDKTPPPVGYGDTKARSIEYLIYWQPVFDERFDGVKSTAEEIEIEKIKSTWEGPHSEKVTGHISEPYIRTSKINLQSNYTSQYGFDGWRIKIIRVTPESLTSYLKLVTYVDSLTEIYGTKLRYPYSCMVYSKFNAEYFTRVPARSYDTKLLKVLIPNNYHPIKKTYGCSDAITMDATTINKVATNGVKVSIAKGMKVYFDSGVVFTATAAIGTEFSGLITNNGTLTGNTKVGETGATVEGSNDTSPATASTHFWDGGFRYTREWTDNPAWCFYDLLTNSRYGLGDYIDKSQVDKWALYEIAQYCDVLVPDGYGSIEPRFTINHIITSRDEAYKVLNDMASIFRGLAYYSNGLIFAVQDAYKKPVYQFNNANVTDGNFTYSSSAKKTRHSVALVRYIDRRNLFQPSVEYVENEEAIKRYGIRQLETTALGCTSRGQARRFGLWMLASEFQETESVAFSVGQDGGYLKPGDVLQLYDQNRTPLKFGGRTNVVLNVGVAPSVLTYDNPAGTPTPVTGNSIIIDNVINFNDKFYKFSLLTPTYYYDTADIGDNLDSNDINQIRRSQIQDLYFYGPHAQTVTGYYRSDYSQGGSGIATQIYFHTGLLIDGVDPIGTGNQLDFENYVITGYTNDYVQGNTEVSYSGGCFSGENLIWSIEPNDPADDEFISGNFSTYRVINVSENDDTSSYNVSALAYSSGKYEDVEGRLTFQSPSAIKAPIWPELVEGGTAVYSAMATVLKEQPNEPVGVPVVFEQTPRLEKYPTIEIKFAQAGFNYRDGTAGVEDTQIRGIDPNSANPKAIRYLICVKRDSSTLGVGFVDTGTSPPVQTFANVFGNDASMQYLQITASVFKEFYAPHQFKYIDGDTAANKDGTTDNPYLKGPTDTDLLNEFLFEFLATSDTSFWVAIFAVNNNMVSKTAFVGLIPGSKAVINENNTILNDNKIKATDVFSTVELVTISALSSEDGDPSPDTEIVELKTTEPSFSWTMGDERVLYDDLGNRLYIPSPYNNYRITIRENTNTATSFESPIFVELTGYHSPADTANFVFLRDYNDPNMIESLVGNPDASGYKLNDENPPQMEWISDQTKKGTADYFKVEISGVIFKNSPENFPIRDFELVVEAHDSDGTTSAGNKVWDNTIGSRATETYATRPPRGWDIFAGKLAVPSGIVFATTRLDTTLIGNNGFLLAAQAYNRDYPYLATAAIYADGTLNLRMEESKAQNGDVILNSNQIRDSFSEVAGLVYYFTTGDSTLQDEVSKDGVVTFNRVNMSPTFSIDKNNIPDSIALGNMAIRKKLPYKGVGGRLESAVADTGASDAENKAVAWDNSKTYEKGDLVIDASGTPPNEVDYVWIAIKSVDANGEINKDKEPSATSGNWWKAYWPLINVSAFRDFALLEGQDPSNFTIPFPAIHDPLVTNIDLSIALFDKLSLLRYFESDGVTPKRETVTTLDNSQIGQRIPLILTDKTLNLSSMPVQILDGKTSTGIDDEIKWGKKLEFTTEGESIHLKELSVLSQKDGAGSYKSWFDFEIQPETDFIKGDTVDDKGKYVGPQYAFTPDITEFTDPTCDTHSTTTVDCNSTEKMSVGQQVTGSGIPDGTTITLVNDLTTFTISQAATSSINNTTLTFTTVSPTLFLHRGFKSKNIKNITLELSTDYQYEPLSNYWYQPDAPLFKGITNLKIPEFAYLKVEFNEPIDPTKYWLNVDYNQTAGGNEEQKTVEITDSKQNDINSNIRDYVMEESNPEPTCYISEKNEKYAKFFIAPFFSRPIAYRDSAEAFMNPSTVNMGQNRRLVVVVSYYFTTTSLGYSTYLGSHGDSRTGPLRVGNSQSQYLSTGAGAKFSKRHEFYFSAGQVPNLENLTNLQNSSYYMLFDGSNQAGSGTVQIHWITNLWVEDTLSDQRVLLDLWNRPPSTDYPEGVRWYYTRGGKRIFWDTVTEINQQKPKGIDFSIFAPEVGYHSTAIETTDGAYYYFVGNSMLSAGNLQMQGAVVAQEGPYTYHSSPELENYAWRVSQDTKVEKVVHNIRIQGGLMISDEYSAPVLP